MSMNTGSFAFGSQPIWRHHAFADIFADAFVPKYHTEMLKQKQPPLAALSITLDLLSRVLASANVPGHIGHGISSLNKGRFVLSRCSELCLQIPASTSDAAK